MKTTVVYKDASEAEYADAAPSIDLDAMTVCMIDADSCVVSEDAPLSRVARVVFEPEADA